MEPLEPLEMLPQSPALKRNRPSTTSLTDDDILHAMETTEDKATQKYLLREMQRREAARKTAEKAEEKTAEMQLREAAKKTAEKTAE